MDNAREQCTLASETSERTCDLLECADARSQLVEAGLDCVEWMSNTDYAELIADAEYQCSECSPLPVIEACETLSVVCDGACRDAVTHFYSTVLDENLSECRDVTELMQAAAVGFSDTMTALDEVHGICIGTISPAAVSDPTEDNCLDAFRIATDICLDEGVDIFTSERCSSPACLAAAAHLTSLHAVCMAHSTWPLEAVEFQLLEAVSCPCVDLDIATVPHHSHREGISLNCSIIAADSLCHAQLQTFMTGLMDSELRMEDACCVSCRRTEACLDQPVCQDLANANLVEGNCRNVMMPSEYPGMQLLAICPILCHTCLGIDPSLEVSLDSCAAHDAPTITLGGLFPLNELNIGSWAAVGTELQSAMLFSCARINADCDFLPGVNLNCIARDTSFDGPTATRNANELLQLGVQGVIGAVSSQISMDVASAVFGPAHITQISPSSTLPDLSDTSRYPFFFRTTASDIFQAVALKQLVQEFGFDHVATIATSDAYASSLAEAFESYMQEIGVPVVESQRFSENATPEDVMPAVSALYSAGAQTIFIAAVSHDTLTVLEDLLARGMYGSDYVLIGTDGSTEISPFMINQRPNPEGLYTVIDGMLGVRPKPASGSLWMEFIREWQQIGADRFGASNIHSADAGGLDTAEAGVYAGYTADAVYAYAHALEDMFTAGIDISTDTSRLGEFLANVNFEGMTGQVSFNALGDRAPAYNIIFWEGGAQGRFETIGGWSEASGLNVSLSFNSDLSCNGVQTQLADLQSQLRNMYSQEQLDAAVADATSDDCDGTEVQLADLQSQLRNMYSQEQLDAAVADATSDDCGGTEVQLADLQSQLRTMYSQEQLDAAVADATSDDCGGTEVQLADLQSQLRTMYSQEQLDAAVADATSDDCGGTEVQLADLQSQLRNMYSQEQLDAAVADATSDDCGGTEVQLADLESQLRTMYSQEQLDAAVADAADRACEQSTARMPSPPPLRCPPPSSPRPPPPRSPPPPLPANCISQTQFEQAVEQADLRIQALEQALADKDSHIEELEQLRDDCGGTEGFSGMSVIGLIVGIAAGALFLWLISTRLLCPRRQQVGSGSYE
eukprot:SAG31_NODE_1277_length_9041_cov_22.545627_2_plen_1080_part_00